VDYPRAGRRGTRRWIPSLRLLSVLVLAPPLALVAACVVVYLNVRVPAPDRDVTMQATVVTYADGSVLGTVGVTSRRDVPLSQVPLTVRHAVLAAEDRGFYTEEGVSPQGIARAMLADVQGKALEGGSTITQQYVKNAFLTSARTATRKFTEIFIAVKLANEQSKDQILQDYLNTIYFGRGAYGIEAAAEAYFGRDVSALSVAQAAYLGAVIQAPSAYDPVANPAILPVIKARWSYVVKGMVSSGWLGADQARGLGFPALEPLRQSPDGDQTPYLMALVENELSADGISEQLVATGGLRVRTTLQRPAEQAAVRAVQGQVLAELSPHRSVDADVRVGLASVRTSDGAVVALYSGANFDARQYNDATESAIPAGQVFDPLLAAGLIGSTGRRITDARVQAADVPPTPAEQKSWSGRLSGVRAVLVGLGLSPQTLGLSSDASLIGSDVNPDVLDLASAYGALDAGGRHVTAHLVAQITDSRGSVIYSTPTKPVPLPRGVTVQSGLLCRLAAEPTLETVAWQPLILSAVPAPLPGAAGAASTASAACGVTGTSLADDSAWAVATSGGVSTAIAVFRDAPHLAPSLKARSLDGVAGHRTITGDGLPARTMAAYLTPPQRQAQAAPENR
jgi:membrane peptidoglycan carboxypeptidase